MTEATIRARRSTPTKDWVVPERSLRNNYDLSLALDELEMGDPLHVRVAEVPEIRLRGQQATAIGDEIGSFDTLLRRPAWHDQASCRGGDSERWFPGRGTDPGELAELKRICESCPAREPCLEFALTNGERFGLWGGKSERERRGMRKARDRARRLAS
jgi:WhiB family transcriptional regulator, redox-sensing transcriptional regulator